MLDLLKRASKYGPKPKAKAVPAPVSAKAAPSGSAGININVGVDLAATVGFLRAAKSQAAAEQHLAAILREIAQQAACVGWQSCATATASNPAMHALLNQFYADGRRDGARNVTLPADFAPALAAAMRAAAESQPAAPAPVVNVNVPVPSVTVEVPQRPFTATPGPGGVVTLRPVPE